MKKNNNKIENEALKFSMLGMMVNPQNPANICSPMIFKELYDEFNEENKDGDRRKE